MNTTTTKKTTKVAKPETKMEVAKPKTSSTRRKASVSLADIEKRAYEIYIESGCIEGQDAANWAKAEAELKVK